LTIPFNCGMIKQKQDISNPKGEGIGKKGENKWKK
jgi:hypothetical protein